MRPGGADEREGPYKYILVNHSKEGDGGASRDVGPGGTLKLPFDCEPLDDLFGGGVESGCLTLLYGEGGSGKTNLCLQLARTAARVGKKTVFLDTEGISAERLQQIWSEEPPEAIKLLLHSEPATLDEQEAQVEKAAKLAEIDDTVALIILDSATMHYRLTRRDEEMDERKNLTRQVTRLMRVARKRDRPVVLTSQVYTDIETGRYEPLGGHMLTHAAKAILKLERVGPNVRLATLMKHRHRPEGLTAKFRLTDAGAEP